MLLDRPLICSSSHSLIQVPTVENGSNLCKKRDVCAGEPSLFHSHQKLAFFIYRRYKYQFDILCWLGGGERSVDGVLPVFFLKKHDYS